MKSKSDYNMVYQFYLENDNLFDNYTRIEYKMDFIQYLTKCDNVPNETIKSFLIDKCTKIEWKQFKQEIINCLTHTVNTEIEKENPSKFLDLTYETDEFDSDYEPEKEFDSESEIGEEPSIYCNICKDILLNHIYRNVCKKHTPSYALHDDEIYDELTLKKF